MSVKTGTVIKLTALFCMLLLLCGCSTVFGIRRKSEAAPVTEAQTTADTSAAAVAAEPELTHDTQTSPVTNTPVTTVLDALATTASDTTATDNLPFETDPGDVVITRVISGSYVPPSTTSIAETTVPPSDTSETTASDTTAPETKPAKSDYKPYVPQADGRFAPVVLMYHLILEEPYTSLSSLFVRPSDFEEHLETLTSLGYEFLFADNYKYTDSKSVILTFDDGYVDNYTEMFPILKKYNARATIFLISSMIDASDYLSSDMIREMSASGLVSFQCHTATHVSLASQNESDIRRQFERSTEVISRVTGKPVTAIAYPSGRYNNTVLRVASEYFSFGYTTDYSVSTKGYSTLALPRVRINRGVTGAGLKSILGF